MFGFAFRDLVKQPNSENRPVYCVLQFLLKFYQKCLFQCPIKLHMVQMSSTAQV